MARKEIVSVAGLPQIKLPLSRAVRFGDLVFVSGTPGWNPQTRQWGDIREQVRLALEAISTILTSAGTSLENIVSVTTYLKRREDFEAYNEVYRSFFPKDPPARATIQTELVNPDMLVEIACIAGIAK
jgi:2-iminobutanoate/2-iminopropanoate deaminase